MPSGSSLDGITFSSSIPDGVGGFLDLKITDAFDFFGSNALGLIGGDEALLDGDVLDLAFPDPIVALGPVRHHL